MAYLYSKGKRVFGDIEFEGDTNTQIDFEDDYIGLVAGGTTVLAASGTMVGIGTTTPDRTLTVAGDIGIDQFIYHNGDADTLMKFDNNTIILKAGGKSFIKAEKKGSAPHEVTINDGSNNIDFVVRGNGSNQGNPGMFFDASNNRVGINGVGSPSWELDVAGDIGLAEYIYHRTDTDTYIRFQDNDVRISAGGAEKVTVNSNGVSFTSKATDLSGSQIVGGVWQLDDGIIQNPNSGYSRIYFPADDNMNETVGPVSTNYKIAPYDGSAIKMQIKTTTNFTGKTLTGSLHIGVGTTNAYSATPALSVGVDGAASNTVYTFNFEGLAGSGFNEGNIFGFSLELSENYAGNETIHFTTAVRFNPYA